MKAEHLHTRDRRESRFEREEKLSQPMATLTGKTGRDRNLASPKQSVQPAEKSVGVQIALVAKIPPASSPTLRVTHPVSFQLNAPNANSVQLAATFNGWNPGATTLSKESDALWHLLLPLEPGDYEYRFVVDGVWQEDPSASRSIANPFGSRNSIVHVA